MSLERIERLQGRYSPETTPGWGPGSPENWSNEAKECTYDGPASSIW